jgi:predicted DNA-binding protein
MKKYESERDVFSTRLNPELVRRLKYLSADEKKPLNVLLEEAIEMLLKARQRK